MSRGLALNSRLYLVSTDCFGGSALCVWRASRDLALHSRLYLGGTGRVLAAVRHVSGGCVAVWL